MTGEIQGLHHVTALTGDAAANVRFWTRSLGLRLVKRTVNFDAPLIWHLYYGDRLGHPGSVMTFFAFQGAAAGMPGTGETRLTQFSVPQGSLDAWASRLESAGDLSPKREEVFGEERLRVEGPEGIGLTLTSSGDDPREPWVTEEVATDIAVRGFHGVTLCVEDRGPTADILTGLLGYAEDGTEEAGDGSLTRYRLPGGGPASVVDMLHGTGYMAASEGAGSVHHIAFSVADDAAQEAVRSRVADAGLQVTSQIDRDYFRSIYFRTPGGVLFEVATAEPGFAIDEAEESLGEELRIPRQHRHMTDRIKASLPDLGV